MKVRLITPAPPRSRAGNRATATRWANILRARLLVLPSSRMEGGANVISEAVVAELPEVASRIAGSIGLLGADYPGYYPVEDEGTLRALLLRAESPPAFYRRLEETCASRRQLFTPERERAGWARLLGELR